MDGFVVRNKHNENDIRKVFGVENRHREALYFLIWSWETSCWVWVPADNWEPI